jgi:hypothetical protein
MGEPMSRSAFQEHYDELTREINALTGELADADARKRLASAQRRIDILYRTPFGDGPREQRCEYLRQR